MGYNVAQLADYVENKKNTLVRSIVFGGKYGDTISKLRKQLGVKTSEQLNYLDVTPELQDGKGCGFTKKGDTVLSQRTIDTAVFKVNDEWCPDDLLGKYSEFLVRYSADANAEDGFPFEEEILGEIVKGINKQMEKIVWQGEKGEDLIDGFLTLAEADGSTVKVSYEGTDVYEAVKKALMSIPDDILDNAVMFVSPSTYRALVMALVEKNLYHFPVGADIEDIDITFPGSSVRIHKTMGLAGVNDKIYISTFENMVYATDMMGDKEEIRVWFSDDDDVYRIKAKWNAGVNTLFGDAVVLLSAGGNLA